MKYAIIGAIWAVVALLIIITPQPEDTDEAGRCLVELANVGVVNFPVSAEECERIHEAIARRIKHERT